MRLGTAFQVIDDVLDYAGNAVETGKNLGDDLREGKVTLPLIHVMNHGNEAQRTMVRSAIETGDGDFAAIAQAVAATGALDYARSQALEEAQHARACAENLAPSVYRDALVELTSIAVDRDR
jgi:octaprenyl-diphosphate synthase